MPGNAVRQRVLTHAKRIVVKVGTSSLTGPKGRLDLPAVRRLCGQITAVMARGVKVTLVSSGAIGAGIGELDLPERPKDLPTLQAVAAVGQGQLMRVFHDEMAGRGVKVAQVLLSRERLREPLALPEHPQHAVGPARVRRPADPQRERRRRRRRDPLRRQ